MRRTVPPSAEIEAQIDQLLAVGVGENPRESLSELARLVSCGPIAAPSLANLSSGGPERKRPGVCLHLRLPWTRCRRSRVVFSAAGNRSKIRRAFRLVST